MSNTIIDTNFNFPGQKSLYKGKVRAVYNINDEELVMVATDRLSAFDVVMPKGIPYKGQILNQIATKMMAATQDLVPNWLTATPDPNVAVGHLCEPFKNTTPPPLLTGSKPIQRIHHLPLTSKYGLS